MFGSLRSRLLLSYLMVAAICLVVSSVLLAILIGPLQRREIFLRLLDRTVPTVLWVRELHSRSVAPADIVQRFNDQAAARQIRMLLVDPDGKVVADSAGEAVDQYVGQTDSREVAAARWPVMGEWVSPNRQRLSFVALPATPVRAIRSPLPADALVVILATQDRNRLLLDLLPSLGVAAVLALVISALAAWLTARSLTRPLQRVTAAAEAISRGHYDPGLQIDSPDEVHRLAESFNNMASQVKASQQSQRDFVANVSHDLKTPLTSIRGFAQAILDGTAQSEDGYRRAAGIIKDEAERMTRLVDSLLALAKISADKDRSNWIEVDLAALVRTCVDQLAIVAQQKQVRFELDLRPTPRVYGSPDRLAQVLTNLLDNAVKHTPTGSEIFVATAVNLAARGSTGRAQVSVTITDAGPGIPPQDILRIFERFYQVDKSRAKHHGSGLGLAIAKEIVEAHGGTIRVENHTGAGARFSVTLPAD
jgi:two-component system, OmpR family, sensor kinase